MLHFLHGHLQAQNGICVCPNSDIFRTSADIVGDHFFHCQQLSPDQEVPSLNGITHMKHNREQHVRAHSGSFSHSSVLLRDTLFWNNLCDKMHPMSDQYTVWLTIACRCMPKCGCSKMLRFTTNHK